MPLLCRYFQVRLDLMSNITCHFYITVSVFSFTSWHLFVHNVSQMFSVHSAWFQCLNQFLSYNHERWLYLYFAVLVTIELRRTQLETEPVGIHWILNDKIHDLFLLSTHLKDNFSQSHSCSFLWLISHLNMMYWSMVELLLNEPWNSKLISLKPRLYHGVIYVIDTNDKLLIVIEKYVK